MTSHVRQYPKTRLLRGFGLTAAALMLSACDVGDGTRPVSMTLLDGSSGETEINLNQCFEGSVAAVVEFSNGQAANFLQPGGFPRPVELTSSDESVVVVSDGSLEVPLRDNQAYFRGALIPVAPGTATITARYSEFEEQIDVTVVVPDSIEIRPDKQTVARGGFQLFDAVAVFDGVEVGVTPVVNWSLEDANGNEVDIETAQISADGLFQARELGGPFTVKAGLTACSTPDLLPPTVDAEDLRAQVSIEEAEALILEPAEIPLDDEGMPLPLPPMVTGTARSYRAFATFDDPADGRHDVSLRTTFSVTEPGLGEDETTGKAAFLVALGTGSLQALAATEPDNPLQLQARFGNDEAGEELVSNLLEVEIVEGMLEAIRISPEDVTAGLSESINYSVEGDYRLADDSVLTLDVTRQVTFTSSDPAVAQVRVDANNPGRVTAAALEPSCTRISVELLATPGVPESRLTDETQLFVIDDTVACAPESAP